MRRKRLAMDLSAVYAHKGCIISWCKGVERCTKFVEAGLQKLV
jgi:hypothetical protein